MKKFISRDLKILTLNTRGLSNLEIALELGIRNKAIVANVVANRENQIAFQNGQYIEVETHIKKKGYYTSVENGHEQKLK